MRIIYILSALFLLSFNIIAQSSSKSKVYEIWDDQPSPNSGGDFDIIKAGGFPFDDDWESQSYPIGNGYMGASLFGRTDTERIQITEKTLCNEGLYGLGGLTNFCEIFLDINHQNPENYSRSLNLNDAISTVKYTHEGVEFRRDYFMSYPDNVLVVKLSANKKGKISFTLRPEIPYLDENATKNARSGNVIAQDDLITLSGELTPFNLKYEAQIKVINDGGNLWSSNETGAGQIVISNANSITLLVSAVTNYELSQEIFLEGTPSKKLKGAVLPHQKASKLIKNASEKGFENLLQSHLADYQNLFSRVNINFNGEGSKLPTKKLLENYQNGNTSSYLEELMFQYGRYLLIASSRKGALPSGLQGVWSQYKVTPWTGGYWHNINVQMNYWGAFNTNLAETFLPYIDYYNAYLPEAKTKATEYIKKHNPSVLSNDAEGNGWTIGTAAGPFKISGPGSHSGPGTGGFTTKLFWDYYDFTRDATFLNTTGYPAIAGMSKFLSKTVKPSKDGFLLVDPSASPEQRHNGPHYTSVGTTFDQGFITENHNDLIKASEILGQKNKFLELAKYQISKLDPIIIGESGQIKEYREEIYYSDIGDKHHRHISHLCPLYPGTLINSETPELIEAAIVTLDLRGNDTTGWAMAHRMNARARTKEGDKAYEVYKKLIQERTMPNLWTTHPPFQIDANFGCVAGVAEMLLQSHEGFIEPLPALPLAWKNGAFKGLVARGNFEISAVWKKGKPSKIEVLSRSGGTCKFKFPSITNMKIRDQLGNNIEYTKESKNVISFKTDRSSNYVILF